MEIPVINIGNSKGIRLPKSVIEQYNIKESIYIHFEKGKIILIPKSKPRKGWEKEFMKMHDLGDDKLLINDLFDDEEFEEWK